MTRALITEEEINPYFLKYIEKVDENVDLVEAYQNGMHEVDEFFENISAEKHNYKYAEGKWTIKEVLQHLIDTERIFAYRILRIARADKTPLKGYEQDDYIEPSGANAKSMGELLYEYNATRQSTIALLDSLSATDLAQVGTASNGKMSARAAAFVILGHDIWHMEVIKEKYLG